MSVLPSLLVLGTALLVALSLTRTRVSPRHKLEERAAASTALAVLTAAQAIHFVEESLTDMPAGLGELLGLPAMAWPGFLAFNLVWIGIWVASVFGVRSGRTWAFLAAWFLAVAGVANGVLHPLLAAASGGYFPGLWTAPFVGVGALWLWGRLKRATEPVARAGVLGGSGGSSPG